MNPVAKSKAVPTPVKAQVKAPAKAPVKKATSPGEAPTPDVPSLEGKGKGKASETEKAPKVLRAKNAYMFFMAEKRDSVKGKCLHQEK